MRGFSSHTGLEVVGPGLSFSTVPGKGSAEAGHGRPGSSLDTCEGILGRSVTPMNLQLCAPPGPGSLPSWGTARRMLPFYEGCPPCPEFTAWWRGLGSC